MIASCVAFADFWLIHMHLWSTEDGLSYVHPKAIFTTSILFLNSLWFYALRFGPWNPTQSFFLHDLSRRSNLGVFVVKLVQGYVSF